MISPEDIVTIKLEKPHITMCLYHAERCTLEGRKSQIFGVGEERESRNAQDQVTGQFGTCAFAIWQFEDGLWLYNETRKKHNRDPWKGDGGSDLNNYQIDVKTSRFRSENLGLLNHRLPVRPAEYHRGTVYVLCISDYDNDYTYVTNHFIGWCTAEELPKRKQTSGPFKGAKVRVGYSLHPMSSFIKENWMIDSRAVS